MINEIDKFHDILLHLNNYDKEDKERNIKGIRELNELLVNKGNGFSEKTYEWQCYMLLMHHKVIKELIKDFGGECGVDYEVFRENLMRSIVLASKYSVLNQSVMANYPQLTPMPIPISKSMMKEKDKLNGAEHNEETVMKEKEEEVKALCHEVPNIYYKEEMSFDGSGSSIVFEENDSDINVNIHIDEVNAEISDMKDEEPPKDIEEKKDEEVSGNSNGCNGRNLQEENLIEGYFNAKSQAFIQRSQKESQLKEQSQLLLPQIPSQQQQQQQQPKSDLSQFKTKSSYIIDLTSNDSSRRIEELIEKINSFGSIISFIQNSPIPNDTSISSLLHNSLALIPKKSYDKISACIITTLTLYFFPFLTENQKNSNLDRIKSIFTNKEPSLISFLLTNLLHISTEKENRQFVTDILCTCLNKKTLNVDTIKSRINAIRTLDDIKELFQLQILFDILYANANQGQEMPIQLSLCFANVSFLIVFLVKNGRVFPLLNIHQMLLDCIAMKKFYMTYTQSVESLLSIDYDKSNSIEIRFNKDKLIKSKDDMTIKECLNGLIDKRAIKRYKTTLLRLKHLYCINDYVLPQLISDRNLSFVLSNNELQFIYSKYNYTTNNSSTYRQMLINLEGNIYQIVKDTFKNNNSNGNNAVFGTFTISKSVHNTFTKLQHDLKKKFPVWDFTLYPFGSITQFLSSSDSDLDVYLDLNAINKDYRVTFVKRLFSYILELDRYAFNRNSFRICLISFTYQGLKIDLSCFAVCPYLHSNLLRCYSLMDSRVSILALTIKHFLSILNLKNDNEKNSTLNSFCWMMLLIVFLQDIIKPPILPKLMMNSPILGRIVEIGGGGGTKAKAANNNANGINSYTNTNANAKGNKHKFYYQSNNNGKTIHQVFDNTSYHYIQVSPDSFKEYERVYHETIKEKNKMTLAELFLKFLEFVIFLFKYDTIFPSFTFFNEAYVNLSEIKEQIKDFGLRRFYFSRYLIKPKGEILFREPFDYNYNPGQSLHNAKGFFEKLKLAYFTLIEYGSFDSLIQHKEKKEDDGYNDDDYYEEDYANNDNNNNKENNDAFFNEEVND